MSRGVDAVAVRDPHSFAPGDPDIKIPRKLATMILDDLESLGDLVTRRAGRDGTLAATIAELTRLLSTVQPDVDFDPESKLVGHRSVIDASTIDSTAHSGSVIATIVADSRRKVDAFIADTPGYRAEGAQRIEIRVDQRMRPA